MARGVAGPIGAGWGRMLGRWTAAGLVCLVLLAGVAGPARAEEERGAAGYVTVLVGSTVLLETGHAVSVDDEYIDENGGRYRVVRVTGDTAEAQKIGDEDFSPAALAAEYGLWAADLVEVVVAGRGRGTVGIYASHSDESYQPSDGTATAQGRGGIYRVADSLAAALRRNGFDVMLDQANHNPHDAAAYDRSRRTAMSIMRRRPVALVDVHRDTAPPEAYEREVGGRQVTRVMLVVGRQNPNMRANLAFAKRLAATARDVKPGLIRGIFMAKGKYNQDLHPRAILAEVGAHRNERQDAERGAAMMANVLTAALTGAAPPEERRGSSGALLWVIGLSVIGGGAWLVVSSGGWRQAWQRLRRFGTEEFAGALQARRRRGGAGEGRS